MTLEHWILGSDDNNCNWIGLGHSTHTHCTTTRWSVSLNTTPALRSPLSQTPFYPLESQSYFYFCPISGWLWVLLAQEANWNSSCSSVTASCLPLSCYDCISSPDSTVKPFEGDSSWKLPPYRRDYSFYPHHLLIYVLVSFSSCFKGLHKTESFFLLYFFPLFLFFFF